MKMTYKQTIYLEPSFHLLTLWALGMNVVESTQTSEIDLLENIDCAHIWPQTDPMPFLSLSSPTLNGNTKTYFKK